MLPVILGVVIKEAIAAVGKKAVKPDDLANEVQKIINADPRLQNALSQEKPYQSGVTWGGGAGVLMGAGMLWQAIAIGEFNPEVLGPAIGGILAGAYTLYRRWWPGLKPLFSGRK